MRRKNNEQDGHNSFATDGRKKIIFVTETIFLPKLCAHYARRITLDYLGNPVDSVFSHFISLVVDLYSFSTFLAFISFDIVW